MKYQTTKLTRAIDKFVDENQCLDAKAIADDVIQPFLEDARRKGMMQGAAICIGIIGAKESYSEEIAGAFGLNRKSAKKNEVDKYDMKQLEPLFKWQEK